MTAILLVPMGWAGVPIVWGLMGILFWIGLIGLIVLVVRRMRTPARDPGHRPCACWKSATRAARSRVRSSSSAARCSIQRGPTPRVSANPGSRSPSVPLCEKMRASERTGSTRHGGEIAST
jgi:hypothetical protein